jgi:hypothetical protein
MTRLVTGSRHNGSDRGSGSQFLPGPGSEDQQRARCSSVLEPAVLAAVDLDQLPEVLASQARLMEGAPLLARQPQAFGLCVRVPHTLTAPDWFSVDRHQPANWEG